MIRKNEIYRAEVCGFSSEGVGVCRVEGCVVFVENAAPDEEYELRITHVGKNAAFGKIEKILRQSPARITRLCPDAKRCGGCDFWHLTYASECAIKAQRVTDALNRLGGQNLERVPLTPAKSCEGYRNKAQYPVAQTKDVAVAGFYKKKSHEIIDIERCRIQPDCAQSARAAVLEYLRQYGVLAYDEVTQRGLLRHIYVRLAAKTGQVLVCLVVNGEALPAEPALVSILRRRVAGIQSIVLNVNTGKTNAVLGEKTRTLWGADAIEDELCGLRFRISPRSFYQINRDQAEILYEKAIAAADLSGKETVLDLYCGTGTITLCLARRAKQVIGVEIIESAIFDAKQNAKENGIENVRFFCADAGQAAKRLREEGALPDVIVVDPPRKGLSRDVLEAITEMSPQRVVYVSCDPATLARDVKYLCEAGYALRSAEAVDLFPRCAHVETVALLSYESQIKI
ncbi:MAG: 23S rRNA (uracil(1939)-C(5))-methyltransferase RlmD [Oscillospiraceae bacterium]|jgi:23S rRNA (uracil1939-C5)-methyltransferase|nr:23S rRNA (uracil(1939)-C(5))-methyltransferase RlmD [Oscillospiraceae bacterium]